VKVETLEINNFYSYKQATVRLNNRGLVLVEGVNTDAGGSNGAGKSTIFDALSYCLYGEVLRPLKLSQLSHKGQGNVFVTCTIKLDDGTELKVERVRDHKSIAAGLRVFANGKNITKSADRHTQVALNNLLHLDWETFKSVVLFPQGLSGFASFPDGQQKIILESLLNIGRFAEAQERTKKAVKNLESSQEQLKQDIKNLDTLILMSKQSIFELKKKAEIFVTAKTRDIELTKKHLDELRVLEPKDEGWAEKLAQVLKRIENAENGEIQELYRDTSRSERKYGQELAELERELSILQRAPKQKKIDVEALLKESVRCPSCGQSLPEQALISLRRDYENRNKDIDGQNNLLSDDIKKVKEKIALIRPKHQELVNLMTDIEIKIKESTPPTQELAIAQKNLAEYESKKKRHEIARASALQKLESLEDEVKTNPYIPLYQAEEVKLKDFEAKLIHAKKEIEPTEKELKHLAFWVEGYSNRGVKSLLLDTVTPFLNQRANEYLSFLTDGQAKIVFNTQSSLASGEKRDKFSVEVSYAHGSEYYNGTSGGERRRADIAVMLALGDLAAQRANVPVRLRLLDEVFEGVDGPGCEKVVSLLKSMVAPNADTVLVMTHNENLKALFEKKIQVVKKDGVSSIIDE
jgi:DNA repair exonuclease SbcCD ATPase subunit